ncbi:hypothetical protein M0R45_030856 [Rubus argutus]|uniref:Uncharacterized protein n=1 Tax=Rubus argutus TaxID=59490 RepID=A0AAW1WEV8_RUBAR
MPRVETPAQRRFGVLRRRLLGRDCRGDGWAQKWARRTGLLQIWIFGEAGAKETTPSVAEKQRRGWTEALKLAAELEARGRSEA